MLAIAIVPAALALLTSSPTFLQDRSGWCSSSSGEEVIPWISDVPDGLELTPDGEITDLAVIGDTLYACGFFTQVAPCTGPWASVDAISAHLVGSQPTLRGVVECVRSDGQGGWFIGGDLSTSAGAVSVVRVAADGTAIPSFHAAATNGVRSMVLSGNTLYIGGVFEDVGAVHRERLAALDATTGALLAWNPNAGANWSSGDVIADLEVDSGRILVAGLFHEMIGGASRTNLAVLDASTGLALSWDPEPDGTVNDLELVNGRLAVGGWFNAISGQARKKLALYDAAALTLESFHVDITGGIDAIAASASTLYVGGAPGTVEGSARPTGCAFDLASGALLAWNPPLTQNTTQTASIREMDVGEYAVYAVGEFNAVAGQRRVEVAALDLVTAAPLAWSADATGQSGKAYSVAVQNDQVAIGGPFDHAGGFHRTGLAAWSLVDGSLLPWAPHVESYFGPDALPSVIAMEAGGSRLIFGGQFESVDGVLQRHIACVDGASGALDIQFSVPGNWHPTSDFVNEMTLGGGRLFFTGSFTLGGSTMINIAAVDSISGALVPGWTCLAQSVRDLELSKNGSVLYVAGGFADIGVPQAPIAHLAALDAATGSVRAWNPLVGGNVSDVQRAGASLFACGSFVDVGGQPIQYLTQIDAPSGVAVPWSVQTSGLGGFSTCARSGLAVFAASGGFFHVGSEYRNGIAAFHARTARLLDWDPQPDQAPSFVRVIGNRLFVLGSFVTISGVLSPRVAIYTLGSGVPQ